MVYENSKHVHLHTLVSILGIKEIIFQHSLAIRKYPSLLFNRTMAEVCKNKYTLPAKNVNNQCISKDASKSHTGDHNASKIMPLGGDEWEVVPVRMNEIIVGVIDMGGGLGGVRCNRRQC